MSRPSPKRAYVSERRTAAAEQTRLEVVEAALVVLRRAGGVAEFALDAVARQAGVTRATVYNQFGSRRGLLEKVFDHLANRGGILQLAEVAARSAPADALDGVVQVFCEFWCSDRAVARIYGAMATDPEIAEALKPRIEHGRDLVGRLVERGMPGLSPAKWRDATDLVVLLTDLPSVAHLHRGREVHEVIAIVQQTCRDVLLRR